MPPPGLLEADYNEIDDTNPLDLLHVTLQDSGPSTREAVWDQLRSRLCSARVEFSWAEFNEAVETWISLDVMMENNGILTLQLRQD